MALKRGRQWGSSGRGKGGLRDLEQERLLHDSGDIRFDNPTWLSCHACRFAIREVSADISVLPS